MIPHDVLISAKVALLERAVKDLFVNHFIATPKPVEAAEAYSTARRQAPPRPDADPEADLIYETVWGEFLDAIVADVRKHQGR